MCPLPNLYPESFVVGWNDTANGVIDWTGSDAWKTPLEWIDHVRGIAVDCLPKSRGFHNVAYYNGVIACCDAFRVAGAVARR